MIMSMYKICVTNRHLVEGDFFETLEKVLKSNPPELLILREKDLSQEEYGIYAKRVIEMCSRYDVECMLHYFVEVAENIGHRKIHLPLSIFLEMPQERKKYFEKIGVSVHSVQEAVEAEKQGASYVTAGHIFVTDCKKGVSPRGIEFLRSVCREVDIQVYAIGGINEVNGDECVKAGAAGVCMMSGYMK